MHDAPFLRAGLLSARRQLSDLSAGIQDAELLSELTLASDDLKRVELALGEFQNRMRALAPHFPRIQVGKL